MRALVTGGAGFIGSNLTAKLLEQGHYVVVLDDFSTGYRENLPDNDKLEIVEGNTRHYDQVVKAVHGAEVVFHMAAQVGNILSLESPDSDLSTNGLGTLNLLKACKETGVGKVVYSSSSAIFGETEYVPIDEAHPQEPTSSYGISKLAAEKYCLLLGKVYGLRVCCLRYFNVYGVKQRFNPYGNVIPIFVQQLLKGEPLTIYGDGNQTRDFIDVLDIVSSNLLAYEREAEGSFNIGTGVATTLNELVAHVFKAVGKEVDVVYAPPRDGEVLHSLADISKAKRELTFSPHTSIEAGVRAYASWYSEG